MKKKMFNEIRIHAEAFAQHYNWSIFVQVTPIKLDYYVKL